MVCGLRWSEVYNGHMSRQPEPFAPGVLSLLRVNARLTVSGLAAAVGVSARQIIYYEQGRHSPSPARLKRLAEVLGTSAQALTGVPREEETLTDLRRFAGLNRGDAARALMKRVPEVTVWKLQAVESGIVVHAWTDRASLEQVVTGFAEIYGTSTSAVRQAWLRAFPQQAHLFHAVPVKRAKDETAVASSEKGLRDWRALNERQQAYLVACFHQDQEAEAHARAEHAAGRDPGPAGVWRKLPFTIKADPAFTGYTDIQLRLKEQGLLDPGAGSSLAVLKRHGLITLTEDQVEVFPLGSVNRVLVELTRVGRACVRAGLGAQAPVRTPAHLLSAWLWENLLKVASAEPDGLPEAGLWGKARFYLGTGFRPNRAASRGYIDAEPIRVEDAQGTFVKEYRWHLTEAGRQHIVDYLDAYRDLYPQFEVDERTRAAAAADL
ncbi:hypothetical protein GCM10017673_44190 [Streptosporangium violaceochromogenes]|nr:hypothetical protein GCM10017673_44190 [Streptosporangium violaceochromogenes]